jgi:hypothetical protein
MKVARVAALAVGLLSSTCRERCYYEVVQVEGGCLVRGDLLLANGSAVNLKGSFRCGELFERCEQRRVCTCPAEAK